VTRDPKKVHAANEHLSVYKGDVEKDVGLHEALVGCRYVVSVVSSSRPSDCVANVVKAIGLRKVERVIFVSRADDTVPSHGLSEKFSLVVGHRKQDVAHDLSNSIDLLRDSGLPYVVLKTNGLTDEPFGKDVVVGDVGAPPPGRIGRADLARFILGILEAPEWAMREATVGTAR
jgi:hypothetical protein